MNPILDFNDQGGASIQIPQIDSDYSFVLNHWKNVDIQLQEIEKDLLQSYSSKRTEFLKKYTSKLQKFKEQLQKYECKEEDDDEEEDDDDEFIEELNKEEEEEFNRLFNVDENTVWDFDSWDSEESEEEKQFYEEERKKNIKLVGEEDNGCILQIYNFELKHSLAWYMINCMDDEIKRIESQIEIEKGFLKIQKIINEVINLIRKSKSTFEAYNSLMKQFSLSELQAKAILETKLREIIRNEEEIEDYIKYLVLLKTFLEELK